MRKIVSILALLLAFCIVSPSAQASLVFDKEYETILQQIDMPVSIEEQAEIDIFDLYHTNNWNNTIKPLQDSDPRTRGIVQHNPTFPVKATMEKDNAAPNRFSFTMAWKFIPDERLTFDTITDAWLRLPIDNLTLGPGSGQINEIKLATYRLYTDEYNITLSDTISGSSFTSGEHGDTVSEHVWTEENYVSKFYRENYLIQHNITTNWTSSYGGVEKDNEISHNFTYIRLTLPLQKRVPYVFILELDVVEMGVVLTLEPLFSNGDNNNDRLFRTDFYYNGSQHTIPLDVDAPVIITDLASSETYGVGFWDIGDDMDGNNTIDINTMAVTNSDYLTIQIPIWAQDAATIDIRAWVGGWGAIETVNLAPGFNTVVYEVQSTFTGNIDKLHIEVEIDNSNTSKVAFLLNTQEDNGASLFIRRDAAPFDIVHHSPFSFALSWQISTSRIQYIPLDQYTIYVVPDPADYEGSMRYIEYANQWEHLLQDFAWVFVDDEGDNDIFLMNIAVGAIMVIGALAYALGAPVTVPLTAVAIGLIWIIGSGQLSNAGGMVWDAIAGFASWVWDGLVGIAGWLAPLWDFLGGVAGFIWQILEFVVHAISWLISNGIHLLALWVVLSVYLLGVYAANGMTNAVTRGRAKKGRKIINTAVFEREIREAFSQYMRLVTLNMSLIGALTGLLLTALKLISPF